MFWKSFYGNLFYPGDRIDLYAEYIEGGKAYYGIFVESIKILAVKDDAGNHIFDKRPASGRPAQLIFEVDEEMFLLLKSAPASDMKIVPVPRNAQYTIDDNATLIKSEHLINRIISVSNMQTPDIKRDENPSNNDDIQVVE